MSSIRSTALEPTRAELRDAIARPAHRAAGAGLRPGDPDRPAHPRVLAAAAGDLPDPAQPALDPERQVADRAALARRHDPDDDRQDRPDGRLRHRALAHPGDHACRSMPACPWPVAVVLVILAGAAFGWFNGFLVEVARIDSFIATLGTGTVIYAVASGTRAAGR